jgi:dynein assembly factor 1
LQLKRNKIGVNGLSDLEGVLNLPALSVLDISDNKVEDPNVLDEIFVKMPALGVLYF